VPFDEAANVHRPVCADVVEDHDVTGLQLSKKDGFQEGLEDLTVGRTFDGHHGANPANIERAEHGRDLAAVLRNAPVRALASRRACVLARHRDVAAGLVDEHEPGRIDTLRELDELAAELLDARLALLYRGEALLFFRVSASLRRIRFIDDRLTLRLVRRWNSHATSWSVRSGFSSTMARTTEYCSGATRGGLPPPNGLWSSAPVSRRRRF
jgi:hypothetical protein